MRIARPSLASGAVLLLALVVILPSGAAEWPMEGADAAHTGVQLQSVIGPVDPWVYQAEGEPLAPPATAYGKLFLGTTEGWLSVLDEVDGEELWTMRIGSSITATPLVEGQTIYVPSGNTLFAVAIGDRSVKWTFEAVGTIRGSPILSGNLIYFGSEDKRLYAVDEFDGGLAWKLKLDDVVASSPSVEGLTIVIGTESGSVYGIHRAEGNELWRTDLGSPASTTASIDRSVAVMATSDGGGGRLHALDVDDGEELWTFPHKGQPAIDPILTTPATSSGLVYFGADGLYCLEIGTGNQVWYAGSGDTIRGSPGIVDSYIISGSYDGIIRCLNKNTGVVVWRYDTKAVLRSGVTIDYEKAFVGGRDGTLFARPVLNRQAPSVTGPSTLKAEAQESIPFEVEATDEQENMLSYHWEFGDGNTSQERSPLHAYPLPGEYTVTVTVNDGTMSRKHSILVTVHAFEAQRSGGDEEGVPMMLVAAVAAGLVAIMAVGLVLLLRGGRSRGGATPGGLEEGTPDEQVGTEGTEEGTG